MRVSIGASFGPLRVSQRIGLPRGTTRGLTRGSVGLMAGMLKLSWLMIYWSVWLCFAMVAVMVWATMGIIRYAQQRPTAGTAWPSHQHQQAPASGWVPPQPVAWAPAPALPSVPPPHPAGWYPDHAHPAWLRWFDGQVWTSHTRPR